MEPAAATPNSAAPSGPGEGGSLQWGLLLPMCYRGEGEDAVWGSIQSFAASLEATTTPADRALLRVHVAINQVGGLLGSGEHRRRCAACKGAQGGTGKTLPAVMLCPASLPHQLTAIPVPPLAKYEV